MTRAVSRTITVPTRPEEIFALLADPARHPEIDGSETVRRARGGSQRLELGSRFDMDMRMFGMSYRMTNEVVEYVENRLIAWRNLGGVRWRWRLEPNGEGTTVTETSDWSGARIPKLVELLGFPRRNTKGMQASLERLVTRFAQPTASDEPSTRVVDQ